MDDKTPIHIADFQSMTEEFSRDNGTSGGNSTVTAGVTPPTVEPENLSEMNVPPSDVPESGGKRVRTRRVLPTFLRRNPYGRCKYTTPLRCREYFYDLLCVIHGTWDVTGVPRLS